MGTLTENDPLAWKSYSGPKLTPKGVFIDDDHEFNGGRGRCRWARNQRTWAKRCGL